MTTANEPQPVSSTDESLSSSPKRIRRQCRLYARFSPRPGASECDSVEKQIEAMKIWCRTRSFRVVSIHTDRARSGKDRDRPGLYEAIQACKKGDLLLVRDWDRFSRDRTYAGIILDDLHKKGVSVRSISENGDMPETLESKLLNNILLDIAEYRRGIIVAKTKAAMLAHQKAGRAMSPTAPYGYDLRPGVGGKGSLEPNWEEQAALREIVRLREKGRGYQGIINGLIKKGFRPRNEMWHKTTISRILKRLEVWPPLPLPLQHENITADHPSIGQSD